MMYSHSNKSVAYSWKGRTRTDRKIVSDLLQQIRLRIENFFDVQRKRKLLIKGIGNGELIFEIGTAFGGLCCRLP
jgi:hypothetical protein